MHFTVRDSHLFVGSVFVCVDYTDICIDCFVPVFLSKNQLIWYSVSCKLVSLVLFSFCIFISLFEFVSFILINKTVYINIWRSVRMWVNILCCFHCVYVCKCLWLPVFRSLLLPLLSAKWKIFVFIASTRSFFSISCSLSFHVFFSYSTLVIHFYYRQQTEIFILILSLSLRTTIAVTLI